MCLKQDCYFDGSPDFYFGSAENVWPPSAPILFVYGLCLTVLSNIELLNKESKLHKKKYMFAFLLLTI